MIGPGHVCKRSGRRDWTCFVSEADRDQKSASPGGLLFGLRAWSAFLALGCIGCLGVLLLPSVTARRRWLRWCARAAFFAAGVPAEASGVRHLHGRRRVLVVSNHASYLDVVACTALLPVRLTYVAKKELTTSRYLGWFLRRIGTLFIERFHARTSINDLNQIKDRVREGECVVFFPEGTFTPRPGLLPFRMGGFLVAAETDTPVVPMAIRGTRGILPSEGWGVNRGAVSIVVLPPIEPSGRTKRAAAELRDRSRECILVHCGEPEVKPPVMDAGKLRPVDPSPRAPDEEARDDQGS